MESNFGLLLNEEERSVVSDLFTCCSDQGTLLYNSASSTYRHRPFVPIEENSHHSNDPLRLYCQSRNSLVSHSDSSDDNDSILEEKKRTNKMADDPLSGSINNNSDDDNNNNNNAEEDDEDLDALLAQADSMISEASNVVIDGFAIDSDEEGDGNEDGVVDVPVDSPMVNKTPKTIEQDAPPPADPLSHMLQDNAGPPPPPSAPARPTSAPNSGNHPLNTNNNTGGGGGVAGKNFASMTSAMRNLGVGTSGGAEHFANQFKAQTSGFAANLSSMAQRFSSAASGNTPTGGGGGGPNNMSQSFENNFPPPMSVPTPTSTNNSSNNNSPYSSQSNSMHGNNNIQQQQPQQQQQPMMNFELDAEQKTALVEMHVGKLLPGEVVIMFLHNLLHVSDSSGFQYVAGQGNNIVWCCAMTYYRLVLFGTTQDMIVYIMNTVNNNSNNGSSSNNNNMEKPSLLQHPFTAPSHWNASCWPPAHPTIMEMPLATMEKCEKTVYTASTQPVSPAQGGRPTTLMGLQVWAKDGRFWRLTTTSYADTLRAHQSLLSYAFPGRNNLGYLFAFESKRAEVVKSVVTDPNTGQKTVTLALNRKRFDPIPEFQRQFNKYASSSNPNKIMPWKIWTKINSQYQLCQSYPSVIVGPASLDESNPDAVRLIQSCAAFRSEQRLPALAWASGMDGASIWRCSQPRIGLQGNRSSADELVLKHIMEAAKSANALREQPLPVHFNAHLLQVFTGATGDLGNTHWVKESNAALKILDLRPRSAAMANRTGGYGYENTSNYPGTTLQFCNIGNIHAVRDAFQKMTALCLNMSNASDVNWGAALEDTKWLSMIRVILAAAWETAFWVHVHRMPVLLHCSHGWDRTSQVSALAQLMLDPYYRTMEGFACLVEKDFMSFGHPFHTRCAHGEGKGGAGATSGGHHQDGKVAPMSSGDGSNNSVDEGQISPIFLQFLDCVWQIVNQFPECFEFTAEYLLELANNIYSCRFGNMLCDTERERELVAGIRQRTYSVWDHLEQDPEKGDPRAKFWRNKYYDSSPSAGGGVLLMPMPTLLRNVTLWKEKHAQYGPKATDRWRNTDQAQLWQSRPTEITAP